MTMIVLVMMSEMASAASGQPNERTKSEGRAGSGRGQWGTDWDRVELGHVHRVSLMVVRGSGGLVGWWAVVDSGLGLGWRCTGTRDCCRCSPLESLEFLLLGFLLLLIFPPYSRIIVIIALCDCLMRSGLWWVLVTVQLCCVVRVRRMRMRMHVRDLPSWYMHVPVLRPVLGVSSELLRRVSAPVI
jgi:hypothetical protein